MQTAQIDRTTLNPPALEYIEHLEKEIKVLKELEKENKILKERLNLLLYQRYARSAERLLADEGQQLLFVEHPQQTPDEQVSSIENEAQEIKSYTRKKPGRKPIDPSLPRKEEIIDVPEAEKVCACGEQMSRIGEETSEKVEIIPPSMYVLRTIRPKYACRCCEGTGDEGNPTVKIAPPPLVIIPRSIASASLLSYVLIQKYQDHLPFYRQELQFRRIGIEISRQDMCNWQQQVYNKLSPLFDLLRKTIKSGPVLQMDETTVQVMGEEGRDDTQKSYMWLARGGPPGKTVILYEYRETRGGYNAKEFLRGYKGYLQTDGYGGYDSAVKDNPDIIHVGCFAHARRKFFEAIKSAKKAPLADKGIQYIRRLYELEERLRKEQREESDFLAQRKKEAEPILKEFKAWLEKYVVESLPSTSLNNAIRYTLNQWDKLVMYLESPYLTPDNNACENAIRPFVLGRKNWLFNKSPEGAESSCGIYSLIETAKQNSLEPMKYLHELFERCPLATSIEDWKKLLPWNIFTA
jgi:transposase